jgi:hypothetical protein
MHNHNAAQGWSTMYNAFSSLMDCCRLGMKYLSTASSNKLQDSCLSDEFKIIIVDAIQSLCLKFSSKHASMLTFLSGILRDKGSHDFKCAVVEAIFDMIKFIGESRKQALSDIIEDTNL